MAPVSNFEFLKQHDELLFKLAETAERCFVPDPNTTLVKMRQLGEALAQDIAARVGIEASVHIKQIDLLRELDYTLKLDPTVKDAFHIIRKYGNDANHQFNSSTHRDALTVLQLAWKLSCWFHKIFGGNKNFKPGKFVKPQDPSVGLRELEERIRIMEAEQSKASERINTAEKLHQAETEKLKIEKQRATVMAEERTVWEAIAEQQEQQLNQLKQQHEAANKTHAVEFIAQPAEIKAEAIKAIEKSPFEMNEAETRLLIDAQLRESEWIVDSENQTYGKGARPEKGRNKAIAEWPTKTGPADYLLFNGLTPVAAIEAKKGAKNVYSAIDQAKRYAVGLSNRNELEISDTWGDYKVPLVFATNGRPYLKQLEQESGIWFLDVRDSTNHRRALQGWFTPQKIKTYLKQNPQQANQKLEKMDFAYDFKLRPYQIDAIKAVEHSISDGKQKALLAMATGTGKTKTCIALVYRLLKAERFRRILFLIDRSALGEQAASAFHETRMENLQTFADIFGIKALVDKSPDDDTKVHIATIQGMVKRILYNEDNQSKPGVGQYDCIVVDECHRGYLLDRELSDTEMAFRDQSDYQSKYRAVIEYFDAFKIGLTATPALHTSEIFGEPVYSYSYTEAVIDGFLIDHQPPRRITTKLAQNGINYQINEQVQIYDATNNQIELFNTPDEINFDIAQFNKNVINRNFNKAVIQHLIENDLIDPYLPAKTLVFCVTDKHADLVVEIFKEVCNEYLGGIDDDAIQKITGTSDKPLTKINAYKNDRLPNIAVTVDLLTTGIDVPAICNLVFLRRVNSRILFEQMLGRATRRCDEISKETFNIYDAVDIYKQLEKVNSMKPVATQPDITFSKLEQELKQQAEPELQQLAKDQFLAKLQRKRRHLTENQQQQFKTIVGKLPQDFAEELKAMPLKQVAEWFTQHPGLGEILDKKIGVSAKTIIISEHEDEVVDISHGYGKGQKPEDYLHAFKKFVNANSNRMAALQTVVQRPWELTRQNLKELALELEKNHFREQDLRTAWHEVKNEEITARIIGFIRQAAVGEALIPFEQRVDNALVKILASQTWKNPQKQWLEAIAKQMKATTIVDNKALDEGVFKNQLGGLKRANKLFEPAITNVLEQFNIALWQ
jgi:type I restriction enzyme R subunit